MVPTALGRVDGVEPWHIVPLYHVDHNAAVWCPRRRRCARQEAVSKRPSQEEAQESGVVSVPGRATREWSGCAVVWWQGRFCIAGFGTMVSRHRCDLLWALFSFTTSAFWRTLQLPGHTLPPLWLEFLCFVAALPLRSTRPNSPPRLPLCEDLGSYTVLQSR